MPVARKCVLGDSEEKKEKRREKSSLNYYILLYIIIIILKNDEFWAQARHGYAEQARKTWAPHCDGTLLWDERLRYRDR